MHVYINHEFNIDNIKQRDVVLSIIAKELTNNLADETSLRKHLEKFYD
tara:strand:+ start:620 stop:763 length:144 start_codon:yes stop_codon:yes gene_type:complete